MYPPRAVKNGARRGFGEKNAYFENITTPGSGGQDQLWLWVRYIYVWVRYIRSSFSIYMVHKLSSYVNVEKPAVHKPVGQGHPISTLSGALGAPTSTMPGHGKTAETEARWTLEIHACAVRGATEVVGKRSSVVSYHRRPGVARVPQIGYMGRRVAYGQRSRAAGD